MKDRCNRCSTRPDEYVIIVSILTGLERPVQHAGDFEKRLPQHVSILTGLERPVQRSRARSRVMASRWFQSSPALKDRCNDFGRWVIAPAPAVSILTGLERPVQPSGRRRYFVIYPVSILTGLEGPVQRAIIRGVQPQGSVSILTGLERPVQPSRPRRLAKVFVVSILTGLERPVQRQGARSTRHRRPFQSSPALKDRCNHFPRPPAPGTKSFNPHRP